MFFIILDIHAFTVGGVMTTLFIKPRWQYSEIKRFKNCVRSFFFSKHETPPTRKEKPRQVCYLSRVLCAVIRSANATEVTRVTFSPYRNYGIQFARKYQTHSHIHGSRIGVLRIGACRASPRYDFKGFEFERFRIWMAAFNLNHYD